MLGIEMKNFFVQVKLETSWVFLSIVYKENPQLIPL